MTEHLIQHISQASSSHATHHFCYGIFVSNVLTDKSGSLLTSVAVKMCNERLTGIAEVCNVEDARRAGGLQSALHSMLQCG